jgi:hypothetical protein
MHEVGLEYQGAVVDLFNRLIGFLTQGGLIDDGQEIRASALPAGLVCHRGGNVEDPIYNNVHLEIRWPLKYSF